MILGSLIKNPPETYYGGEDKDERIKFVLRKSVICAIPWVSITSLMIVAPTFFIPLLGTINLPQQTPFPYEITFVITLFWYLITFGYFFQNFLNWFFSVLIVTNKKIVDVDFEGITYKNISETTLHSIEDVTSNVKGLVGVIFNVGDVYIQTAAEKREFEFIGVRDPSYVRDLISDLVAQVKGHNHNARN